MSGLSMFVIKNIIVFHSILNVTVNAANVLVLDLVNAAKLSSWTASVAH